MTATAAPPTAPEPVLPEPGGAAATRPAPGAVDGRRLWPSRAEWVDLTVIGALITLAVFGFDRAYGGSRYFIAGVIGAVLGISLAHLCARTRQPLVVVAAGTLLTFFVFGGAVAVPEHAIGGFLPSLDAVVALTDGMIAGWAKLLTTVPPVGTSANLLTVPFLCGLVAGVMSTTIAARTRRPLFALLPPVTVLILSILFGTEEPASLLGQGAAFGVLMLWWSAHRLRRARSVDVGRRSTWRRVPTVLVLLVAALAAVAIGEHLPGAGSHERFVLRERTEPPFDPRDHPSPLNGYRRFVEPSPNGLRETELLEVSGLPAGGRLRLATMDTYDGLVYSVASGTASSGYFQRVGDAIPSVGAGELHKVTVAVKGYAGVWVPDVGELVSIQFDGVDRERNQDLEDAFRYNLVTGTGAVGSRLREGDRYTMTVRMSAVSSPERGGRVGLPEVLAVDPLLDRAERYVGDLTDPIEKVRAIAEGLRTDGYFSDGVEGSRAPSRPGHGAKRLGEMAVPDRIPPVGNGEQYAATAALMSNYSGVPARVVMGFEPADGTAGDSVVVTGDDVSAWIEVHTESGWTEVHDLVPEEKDDPPPVSPDTKPKESNASPPPPPTSVPPAEDSEVDSESSSDEGDCDAALVPGGVLPDGCEEGGLPAWVRLVATVGGVASIPLLVLGSFTGAVAFLKSRRRVRRRTQGPATDRIAGGWREVTDLAFDLGTPIPPLMTRREAAAMIGNPAARDLARHADGDIFGPGEPDEARVDEYWSEVDSTRQAMVADRTRFERWKALVSLGSLRSSGLRRRRLRTTRATAGRPDQPGGPRRSTARPEVATLR